jgi:hypothetical protein
VCDNCLKKSKTDAGRTEFEALISELNIQLEKKPMHPRELMAVLPGNPETIQKVISYLVDEGRIKLNEEGKLYRL